MNQNSDERQALSELIVKADGNTYGHTKERTDKVFCRDRFAPKKHIIVQNKKEKIKREEMMYSKKTEQQRTKENKRKR